MKKRFEEMKEYCSQIQSAYEEACRHSKRTPKSTREIICYSVLAVLIIVTAAATLYMGYMAVKWLLPPLLFILLLNAERIMEYFSLRRQQELQNCVYPVAIGWTGTRYMPELVNQRFREIAQQFQNCYSNGVVEQPDFIIYHFQVLLKPDCPEPVSPEFLRLLRSIGSKVVAQQMQEYGIPEDYESMVHVQLQDGHLALIVARTRDGMARIVHEQNRLYRRYHEPQMPDRPEMRDDWDGKE